MLLKDQMKEKVQVKNGHHFPLILPSRAFSHKKKKALFEKKIQNFFFYYPAILFLEFKTIAYIFFDMWRLFSGF